MIRAAGAGTGATLATLIMLLGALATPASALPPPTPELALAPDPLAGLPPHAAARVAELLSGDTDPLEAARSVLLASGGALSTRALANLDLASALLALRGPPGEAADHALSVAELAVGHRALAPDLSADVLDGLRQSLENLRMSREALALETAPGLSELERGMALAKVATRWQARALGLTLSPPSSPPPLRAPSEAALSLARQLGVEPTAEEREAARTLDLVPPGVGDGLARWIDAFAAVDAANRLAFRDADLWRIAEALAPPDSAQPPGAAREPRPTLADLGIRFAPLLASRLAFMDATLALREALEGWTPPQVAACAPVVVSIALTFDLSSCSNVYVANAALLLDLGGHDTYYNNGGGSNLLNSCIGAAAALLDYSGDDRYVSSRSCGTNGGAHLGSGFLLDLSGNDFYGGYWSNQQCGASDPPNSCGVNGGGSLGAGLLLDLGGNDAYVAGSFGTNGGGRAGTGVLIDRSGNDFYSAWSYGTNGGGGGNVNGPSGVGFLFDTGGDDFYTAGSYGTNGGTFLAVGALIDLYGNDRYSAWAGGTNGGGLSSAGYLFDQTGDDAYSAWDVGTNGGGNLGVGLLVDANGFDTYRAVASGASSPGGTNGGGVLGVGFLVDAGGRDSYTGAGDGTNGGASGGYGFLYDAAGSDAYSAGSRGANGGAHNHGTGLLLDRLGADTYAAGSYGTNGGASTESVGLLVDTDAGDVYGAGSSGTNGGGTYGVGMLLDTTGSDRYTAGSTATNGGGVAGIGLLYDGSGDDAYRAGSQGTNGGGWTGSGTLLDLAGNDLYEATDLATNGGGVTGGSGLLVDVDGTDTYRAGKGGANGGANLGVGALVDLGGRDTYADGDGGTGVDRLVPAKGAAGAQIDVNAATGPPGPPVVLVAAPGPSPNQIQLEWGPPAGTGGATSVSYRIYRSANGGPWTLLDAGRVSPNYVDTGLSDAVLYSYRVTATSVRGESGPSETAQARPYAIEGPFSTVTPLHGGRTDAVYYKVGLRVRYNGAHYGSILEGTHDGPLPLTTPGYPYAATFGPDGDGDGVPSTLTLRYRDTTVADRGLPFDTPGRTETRALDPNDADPSDPLPRIVDGPHARVVPAPGGKVDQVYYKVGLRIRYKGTDYGTVLEETRDGPLPLSTPPYPHAYSLGPDADGDGIPATITLRLRTTTVPEAGVPRDEPAGETVHAVDPDDRDPSTPLPRMDGMPTATATPGDGGDGYRVRYEAIARATWLGNGYGIEERGVAEAPVHDRDRDALPDEAEALACANQNEHYRVDGECAGGDYRPPTPSGLLEDADRILPP